MISACIITYNEEEMILNCLNYLNSLDNLAEICIVDSFSTDNTWSIINSFKTDKIYKTKQQEFLNFGQQKNDCIAMSQGDWILLIDADETYSYDLDRLLGDINSNRLEKYNAFRIDTFMTYPDKRHYVNYKNLDPHIRIWRKDYCSYKGECHERLYDHSGRDLHMRNASDIMNLRKNRDYRNIVMLHHQLLKSRKALLEKGERWESLDMLTKSAEQKIKVNKMSWAISKDYMEKRHAHIAIPIPKESLETKK